MYYHYFFGFVCLFYMNIVIFLNKIIDVCCELDRSNPGAAVNKKLKIRTVRMNHGAATVAALAPLQVRISTMHGHATKKRAITLTATGCFGLPTFGASADFLNALHGVHEFISACSNRIKCTAA